MVQLEILSGKSAGTKWSARRFPVHIGRSPECGLKIEEPGVWDQHLELSLEPADGFILEAHPSAPVILNGQAVQRTALRNGDTIQLGAATLRFWIAEARQRGLKIREALVWAILLAVTLGQVALIYWLLP
ncbi:MAG TPA: FHA domain-containing protein [Candidatus Paceibacterota bacterium]|nr:FHA domain-containing protein [Candidatus Paceibacterota bacterium]